jgi:hypothetical protein
VGIPGTDDARQEFQAVSLLVAVHD